MLGYSLRTNCSFTNVDVYSNIQAVKESGGIMMSTSQVCGYSSAAGNQKFGTVSNVKYHGTLTVPTGTDCNYFGSVLPSGLTNEDCKGANAQLIKAINIDNDLIVVDNEFKINGSTDYTKYIITYSFNIDNTQTGAGGYPCTITKEFANSANETISTGIYKNKVITSNFASGTDAWVEGNVSERIFIRNGSNDCYYFNNDGTYVVSTGIVYVQVLAYNGDTLKAVGGYSYSAK